MSSNGICVISNRRRISLPTEDILYIQLTGRRAVIHASGGRTYETYTTINELEQMLDSRFIRTDRATLVSTKGIHTIGEKIELINGETLDYTQRRKRELKEQLRTRHILRMQQGNCSIEAGFVWSDLLTNLERTSDHCSNIAGCTIDTAQHNLNLHETLRAIKLGDEGFRRAMHNYAMEYKLP